MYLQLNYTQQKNEHRRYQRYLNRKVRVSYVHVCVLLQEHYYTNICYYHPTSSLQTCADARDAIPNNRRE